MDSSPSPNGSIGTRAAKGRFGKGNAGGPGNPYAAKIARWRAIMLDAVTEDDFRAIVAALVEKAKAGDLAAARELLSRLIGRPLEAIDPDREVLAREGLRLREEAVDVAGRRALAAIWR